MTEQTRVTDTTLRSMTERMETAQANGHDRYTALTHQELLGVAIRHRRSVARLQDENERLREGIRRHRDRVVPSSLDREQKAADADLWDLLVIPDAGDAASDAERGLLTR